MLNMSNRKNVILLLTLIVLGVFIIAVLSVQRDEARYATPIARADSTLAPRPIGRAEFVKVDSFDFSGKGLDSCRDTFKNKNVIWIFTDCVPDTGDLLYPAKVNDSLFVMVWLKPNLIKQ